MTFLIYFEELSAREVPMEYSVVGEFVRGSQLYVQYRSATGFTFVLSLQSRTREALYYAVPTQCCSAYPIAGIEWQCSECQKPLASPAGVNWVPAFSDRGRMGNERHEPWLDWFTDHYVNAVGPLEAEIHRDQAFLGMLTLGLDEVE